MKLTQKQIKHLRSLAHSLKPIVRVGQHGVTAAVLKELEIALDHHELLKIKVSGADRELRATMIDDLCQQTDATQIQSIGTIAILFRRNSKAPAIELPARL